MEVLEKEPNKVNVVPSPGEQSGERTVMGNDGRIKKVCFPDNVPVLWQVREVVLRDLAKLPVSISESQPFKVRVPIGFVRAHCHLCMSAGFVTAVPA